ncbi:uncharacterized protein alpk3a [Takifugu flavidus]|uniref:uncharacterized protein alpk3a n=1 Tax=Takifugu flavidus TaxID=433684 RepID=UPI002544B609|nr:uncharacterized protein alpk3a [Takifugu flavidus]
MTSRRPMIRTYSSNGRTSSFSEEEGSSSNGRSESRNTYLSNVRPENSYSRYSHYRPSRSTLCSVMAQLTEDIQPSFERTLKSKAVSENCNVKFTCVVSGYPAPELKWYKDDREMDRYCGLPKYEIHRNGKTHTLHIYNCTLDDAAIYQVSASNSKGIVSCSGVLEVGDMNEYKIHQRFFSKLKQKAENKKKSETEAQSKKTVDKENIQKAKQQISPERPPRKRHVPPPAPSPAIKEAAAVEQQGAAGEINGVSPEVMEAAQMPFKDKEADKDEALSEKALATKKMKISNGVAAEVESSNVSAKSQELRNGGENCYDGGIGLAQFLAETLQSQTSEENQSSAEGDSSTEMALNASNSEDKEKEDVKTEREEGGERQREECERQQGREEELATEKGKEMEKLMMASQIDLHAKHSPESKQHCKAHKDLEHHNIQASISSMLHSVKDFLFGKSKKDSPDHSTNKISHSGASHAEMPPSFQLQQESNQACRPISGDRLPMEIDRTKEPQEVLQAQNVSLRRQGSRHEGSVLCADQPPANKLKFEMLESSIGQSVEMPNDAAESMEISAVPESCSPGEEMPLTGQVLTEAEAISVIGAPDCMEISSEFNNQAASDESEDKYVLSETQKSSEDKSTPTSVEAFWTLPQSVISVSEHKSNNTEVHGDILQEKESGADEKRGGPKPEVARSDNSSSEGQKAEVKFNDVPQSDINRHEIIQLSFSAEERIESCEFEAQNQVRLCSGTANVETKLSPKINELTRGSPVAAASDSLEKDELSKRQESTVPGHEERPEVRSEDSILSPILDLGRHKDRSKLADVFVPELEVKLSRKQERPEVELVEGEGCTSGDEEYFKVAQQESREVQRFWPAGKIPKIQISSTEDLPDIDIMHMQAAKVIDHKPANVADNKPAKVIDHKPANVADNKPAKVIDHKPDNKPAKVIDNKPATLIDNKPAKVTDNKPATLIDNKPAKVIDNKPAKVIYNKPATVIDNKPATLIDNKPAPVTDNKPATLIDNKPAKVVNNKPATVIDNKPATLIDNKPATFIDIKPAPVIDNKSSTVIDNKPFKVINRNPSEGFITPQIEVMEPMLKEGALLAMKKRESESAGLQQHDATPASAAMPQQQEKTDSLLWQRRLQDDCKPPAGKNVAQSGDKMESSGEYVSQDNSSVRLPQMATVPVINVSCIDPKQDEALSLDGHSSDGRKIIETPAAPAFVVPPISVTSHDGECALKPSTQNDSAETESTVTAMRVTKQNVDNAATEKSDKPQIRKQSHEEATEKRSKENALSAMGDGFTPNVGSDGSSLNKTADDSVLAENTEKKTHKEAKIENFVSVLDYQRNHPSVDRLASKPPTHPSLSPSSLRKFMSKAVQELDIEISGVHQSDKPEDDLSGGSTPTLPLSCESSPRMKRRDSLTLIRSATPEELASGARRKIFMPRPKEDGEGTQDRKDSPYMSPSQARRAALLQCPTGQSTPPMERRSPLVGRRMDMLAVPKFMDEPSTDEPDGTKKEEKQTQKKLDPLKAPQVIRKIRAEPFPDASGHLKLWCQFFNVLLDSTIKWFRDEEEILEMRRSGGDESQAALAIILAASQDCGVYGCSISNEYGADTTDFLLSVDVLSQILLKDELEVGEEIEMTPLLFTKGLADWGSWGEKYFGRIMTETLHVGSGCAHKASRVRVIYGLDPIFESGSTCIVKVGNPVAYGTKPECSLAERNGAITKQECKVQNTIREYCKIFSAEARVSENFGFLLEVIPQYLIYRPANSVPYATVEADLKGQCLKHCTMDPKGKLITQTASEVEQKCSTFQHWIHQWTHGNLLVTQMEGVETKLTNIRVVTKSKGYQGLTESGSPEVFEQFLTHHQCNYYCGLLGLIPLKTLESLQPPKAKGSRSPLLNRKLGSSSPQMQRKGQSPQMSRKANSSPKVARKVQETEDDKSGGKSRLTETSVEMR